MTKRGTGSSSSILPAKKKSVTNSWINSCLPFAPQALKRPDLFSAFSVSEKITKPARKENHR